MPEDSVNKFNADPKGQLIKLMGIVVCMTFVLGVAWEFALEEWLVAAFPDLEDHESSDEKWENIWTSFFFVTFSLIIPMLLAFRFIRHWKISEEKLRESEALYRNIVEKVPEIIFRLDENGKITFANTAFKYLGYEVEDLVGKPIEDLVVSTDRKNLMHGLLTKYVGPLASDDLEVEFKTNKQSSIFEQIETQKYLVDSMGIWNVSDEEVFKKVAQRRFLGTLNIGKKVASLDF